MSDQPERPRRRRRETQATPPPQGSPAKGVILVVVAVLVGFALLRDQDASTAEVAVGAPENPSVVEDSDTGSASSTSSTSAAPRPPSDVKVLIANGSDVNGAAGAQTDALEALGYVTGNPTNTSTKVPETVVYYTVGYQAEAEALAAAIGATATNVMALPTPAPVGDMQLSNVLVVVGPDLATTG